MQYRTVLKFLLSPVLFFASAAFADTIPVECRPGAPTVCLLSDPDASQALIALTLPVGSADERPGEYGIAHYVEHLAFRGRDVEGGEMTSGGAGIDSFGNAYTSPWATTYYWTVPPDRGAEAVQRAMAVLSPLNVPPEAAIQERDIVAREREQREDTSYARDALTMDAEIYQGTPLARSVIGSATDIDALVLENAMAFHDLHYDPATAILVLSGDITWAATDGLTGQSASTPRRAPEIDIAVQTPVTLQREDNMQQPERWGVLLATLPDGPAVRAALTVADAFLDSSLPDTPGRAFVRGRDDTFESWIAISEVVPGLGAWDAGVILRPGRDASVMDAPWSALNELWTELATDGLDAETVDRLRDRIVRDDARSRENWNDAAWSLIGWFETGYNLDDWQDWPNHLAAVTAQDVAAVLSALDVPLRAATLDTLPTGTSATPQEQTE